MTNPQCVFHNVTERDMDLLFMEAFVCDPDFASLFIEKLSIPKPYSIESVERSKVDKDLGESDLTVVYQSGDQKRALLIEDKIDAIAMPEQHARYIKRGEKGVTAGEYSAYDVFILCPEKYRETNDEAAKYEYFVSYEECREYFAKKKDSLSQIHHQQISQALDTARSEYKVDINEIAVDSLRKYVAYQKAYFPTLDSRNNVKNQKVNGWWTHFGTKVKGVYILHKTFEGYVDLTISNTADKLDEFTIAEKWLRDSGHNKITVVQTGKSVAFRINVPSITMKEPFETWNTYDLNECFAAIQELTDLANMFSVINKIVTPKE